MKDRVIPFNNIENPADYSKSNISYSQFTMYENCPLQWKLQYIDKIKDKSPNINFIFGTSVHTTIQDWLTVLYSKRIKDADNMNLTEEFKKNYFHEIEKVKESWGSIGDIDRETLEEYFIDGVNIVEWVKKKRSAYFQPTKEALLGNEIPIYTQVLDSHPTVFFLGFIDFALYNKTTKRVKVNDIKTSKSGWQDYLKKDKTKTAQVVLYKKFFADFLEVDIQAVDVEYFIVKRKENPYNMFAQKKVQIFSPASGTVTVNKTMKRLQAFIVDNFSTDGKYLKHERKATKGIRGNSCRFCMFKEDFKRCPKEKRVTS